MADVGISVTLEFMSPEELFAGGPDGPVVGRWFDTVEFAWFGPFKPSGELYVCYNIPGPGNGWSGQNYTGYCNPAYDAAVIAAMSALTRTEALDLWKAAITTFTHDLPMLPLFSRVSVVAAIPDLAGFELNATENELWEVELWDIVATATITEDGGQLVSNSGDTAVTFPAGAVTGTVAVTFTPQVPASDPPSGLGTTSHFFDLNAVDETTGQYITSFDEAIMLTIRYNDVEIADLFEDTLGLYRWTGNVWEKIGARPGETYTLDIENNILTAYLLGLSRFGSMGVSINQRLYVPLMIRSD
jgi:hypothetical protein